MTWHVDDDVIDRYVEGRPGLASAASVEQHLLGCEACRAALAARTATVSTLAVAHGATRVRLRRAVLLPRPSFVERCLLALHVPVPTARLVAASPAMRSAAWLSTALLLSLAVAMSYVSSGTAGTLAFVVTAPVVPLAGVAVAYGWRAEPMHELALTVPYSRWRLALLRTSAVLVASLVAVAALAVALPGVSHAAWLWLVPSLALASVSLALATWIDPARTAIAVGGAWLVLAARGTRGPISLPPEDLLDRFVAFRPAGQSALLAVAMAALVVTVLRRSAYEERSRV